jgi:hypothetical protein
MISYTFLLGIFYEPFIKIYFIIKYIFFNFKRIVFLLKKLYNNSKLKKVLLHYIEKIRVLYNNRTYFIGIFRFLFIFIFLPLPVSYSFYFIIITNKYHFPHPIAIIIVIIASCFLHLTIGYTLSLIEMYIQMGINKRIKDYIYPIYKKNIYIINIINFSIVFIFITIIIYYLIQGIS